jgi:hypothetical protein
MHLRAHDFKLSLLKRDMNKLEEKFGSRRRMHFEDAFITFALLSRETKLRKQ